MEEKERYYYKEYAGDYDILDRNDKNAYYGAISRDEEDAQNLISLLNQQDKRIKELEEELDDAKRDYIPKLEFGLQRANKMGRDAEEENQQLKQQLHDLPKKIVEDFYDEIRHRAILEDDYCPDHNLERKYGVRKCLLENIRTTILKKYGGEENGKSNM